MADIGIVHWDLNRKGGAETVCMNVIGALQGSGHTLTLITLSQPDWDTINAYFNTDVEPVETRRPTAMSGRTGRLVPPLTDVARGRLGGLKEAILHRFVRSLSEDYDLLFSTRDECAVNGDSVQYVHFPRHGVHSNGDDPAVTEFNHPEETIWWSVVPRSLYRDFCDTVSGFDQERFDPDRVLTNSQWTATVIERVHGISPQVVYPPVDTRGFGDRPWTDRENGFVCVGRLSPDKRVLQNIDIVSQLRNRGHDVHLHVVGPHANRDYYRRVVAACERHDHVHLEGPVPRERLKELLTSHRYGLHGKRNEHFGMVVAEFLAAGMVPFVPDGGGQRELVDHNDALIYGSADEAVTRTDTVLSNRDRQFELRESLPDAEQKYGRKRFRTSIRTIINERIC